VSKVFPEINCTAFIGMVAPLIGCATSLVPDNIKSCIARNNPADWKKLPGQQIRSTWAAEKVLFSNAFLTLICFQMTVFIQEGLLKGVSITEDYAIDGLDEIDPETLAMLFRSVDVAYEATDIHRLSMHLSIFQLNTDRPELWTGIADDEDHHRNFGRRTGQTDTDFLADLSNGCLVGIATAQRITKWVEDNMPDERTLNWSYKRDMSPRKTAVGKEFVAYCSRETSFGTFNI
jgi:hypothetical protein